MWYPTIVADNFCPHPPRTPGLDPPLTEDKESDSESLSSLKDQNLHNLRVSPVLAAEQLAISGVSNTRPAMLFGNFQILNIYVAKCLEKRWREIKEPKLNDNQCGFHPGHSTTDQNFNPENFWKILGVCRKPLHMFCQPRESIRPSSSWKALVCVAGVGYGVDGRLLMAVNSLYSYSKVCVRFKRIK